MSDDLIGNNNNFMLSFGEVESIVAVFEVPCGCRKAAMASCEDPVRMNDGPATSEIDLDDPFPAERVCYGSSNDTSDNVSIDLFFSEGSPLDWVVAKQLIVY